MGFILPTYSLDVMCNNFCWKCKSEKEHLFMLFGNLKKCIPFGKKKNLDRVVDWLSLIIPKSPRLCFFWDQSVLPTASKYCFVVTKAGAFTATRITRRVWKDTSSPNFKNWTEAVRNWIIQKMLARIDYDTKNFRSLRGQFVEMVVG